MPPPRIPRPQSWVPSPPCLALPLPLPCLGSPCLGSPCLASPALDAIFRKDRFGRRSCSGSGPGDTCASRVDRLFLISRTPGRGGLPRQRFRARLPPHPGGQLHTTGHPPTQPPQPATRPYPRSAIHPFIWHPLRRYQDQDQDQRYSTRRAARRHGQHLYGYTMCASPYVCLSHPHLPNSLSTRVETPLV
jgi:hypothetical protein